MYRAWWKLKSRELQQVKRASHDLILSVSFNATWDDFHLSSAVTTCSTIFLAMALHDCWLTVDGLLTNSVGGWIRFSTPPCTNLNWRLSDHTYLLCRSFRVNIIRKFIQPLLSLTFLSDGKLNYYYVFTYPWIIKSKIKIYNNLQLKYITQIKPQLK